MSTLLRLECRACGKRFPTELLYACDDCFGPLAPVYDLEAAGRTLTLAALRERPRNVWRYRGLLPLAGEPRTGLFTGCTPLVPAVRLARALGVARCFVKNDAVNHPTCSFKDRVVAMAVEKALELGLATIGAPSTGNLANAVAAAARSAGLRSCVLIPEDLEAGKVVASAVYGALVIRVRGNYDHVNRLAGELSSLPGFGMANVNLRPYYAEGSKTIGYEIAEDLGFRLPDDVVVPMGSGSLLTKLAKAFDELVTLGLVPARAVRFHGAQAEGCAPIASAFLRGADEITPVKPKTIARSIAIGDPASGHEALATIRAANGSAAAVSDEETIEGIRLLAETEGIFTETAGGVTVAAARKLVRSGAIPRAGGLVLCITGNGLKTIEPLEPLARELPLIQGAVEEVEALLAGELPVKPLRLAVLGRGVVGSELVRRIDSLAAPAPLAVRRIAVRDPARHPRDPRITTDLESAVADPEVDAVVELIGGEEPARSCVRAALERGKSVVTANKLLVARHHDELRSLAASHGAALRYEGAVAGGIPILQALDHPLRAEEFTLLMAILNGTSNYVLTLMEQEEKVLAEAVAVAREKGFAEADPTLDLSGRDAAQKLAILAAKVFGVSIDSERIPASPLDRVEVDDLILARRLGYRVRQVALAFPDGAGGSGMVACVQPALVPVWHILASVEDEFNLVYLRGVHTGPLSFFGAGAGAAPTASAVLGDLLRLAAGDVREPGSAPRSQATIVALPQSAHYIRLRVSDVPEFEEKALRALRRDGVEVLGNGFQALRAGAEEKTVAFLAASAPVEKVVAAATRLTGLRACLGEPLVLPVIDRY